MIVAVSESVAYSLYISGNTPGAVQCLWGNAAFSCCTLKHFLHSSLFLPNTAVMQYPDHLPSVSFRWIFLSFAFKPFHSKSYWNIAYAKCM